MKKAIFLLLGIIILTSGCVYSNNTTDITNALANTSNDIYVNNIYTNNSGQIILKPFHPGEFGYYGRFDPTDGFRIINHQFPLDANIFSANGSIGVWSVPLDMHSNDIINANNVSTLSGNGLILKSPDGTKCGILTWTNANTFASTAITCPP